MSAKVHLQVKKGNEPGKRFTFAEHDTFIFGRMPDCHACIHDDTQVSRHHFILEANPPEACLRDLGSFNGTWINGKKFGGRSPDESPEDGAKHIFPEVILNNGDIIRVGQTSIEVYIEKPKEPAKHPVDPALTDFSSLPPEKLAQLIFGSPGDPAKAAKLQIPGYTIEAEVGRGGFGAVYRGRRVSDGKAVAVKVMLARVAANKGAAEKFQREVAVTANLQHSNIIKLLDSGDNEGIFYFTMEFCDGGSVSDLMRTRCGKLTIPEARPIILQCLEGLAYAHAQGFVHRDIKPQNLLISSSGAKLSDFGLSKSFQQAGLSGLTITGALAGTPFFMPREHITNYKYLKPSSDVWSMGATIYNMLTRAYPYEFGPKRVPFDVILNDQTVPIQKRDASIPNWLASVIETSLAPKAKDRYQNGDEFLMAMKGCLGELATRHDGSAG